MPWEKVFISHSGHDNDIIDQMAMSFSSIGIRPFLAERYVMAGEGIPDKIANNMRDSNVFVPVITSNSLNNQWVNQEIGFAYCLWGQSKPSPIKPVVEEGQAQQVKGFLGIPGFREYIPLNRYDLRNTIYLLLSQLRAYINRNVVILQRLTLRCPFCTVRFSGQLPAQHVIEESIARGGALVTCTTCHRTFPIDPYTLQPTQDTRADFSGYRPFQ